MAPASRERVEVFQRAVAATCRAMAHRPALSVDASAPARRRRERDGAGASAATSVGAAGCRARAMAGQDVARVRGEADGVALRLRHHDAKLHQRFNPRARSPAPSSRRSSRCGSRRSAPAAWPASPPISPARTPPAAAASRRRREPGRGRARRGARAVRPREPARLHPAARAARAARQLAQPCSTAAPARTGRRCASSSARQEDFAHPGARDAGASRAWPRISASSPRTRIPTRARRATRSRPRAPTMRRATAPADDSDAGGAERDRRQRQRRTSSAEAGASEDRLDETTAQGADEDGDIEAPFQTPQYLPPGGEALAYRVFTTRFDEVVEASELCSPLELARLRSQLDQQLGRLQGMIGRLANRLQRRLLAQQTRSWDFDLDEGLLDTARLTRVVVNPEHRAVVQAREGHRVPRHRGLAADRQLGLDARPADRGRRDVRRHPRAHAGALRRQGRAARLHDPQLEGRPEPRAVAARGQAAQPRPPQRPAPHRLQAGRQPLAARAAQSRPDAARGPAQGEHRRRGDPLGAPAPARARPSSAAS